MYFKPEKPQDFEALIVDSLISDPFSIELHFSFIPNWVLQS